MPKLPRLDIYLAATMVPSKRLVEVVRRAGLTEEALEAERKAARTAGFFDPRLVSAKTIEARFGPPTIRKPEALEYTLLLWPDHVFRWGLDPQGHAFHEGFVLNEMESVQGWIEPGSPSARAALRPWHHTQAEVRQMIGEPDVDQSWGSASEWLYESEGDGLDLLCLFDYGLLTEMVHAAGLVRDHRERNPDS